MDSDPIMYGDGPEYDTNRDLAHDDQPHPKRARLSSESEHVFEVNASVAPNPTTSPTTAATASFEHQESVVVNDNAGHQSENGAIPGLFLASDVPAAPQSEPTVPQETTDRSEVLTPQSTIISVEVDTHSLGRPHAQNDLQEDDRKDAEDDIYDEMGVAQEEPSDLRQLPVDEGDVLSGFRDREDFLEKGKANLGDPEAEWQLDSSAENSEDEMKDRSAQSSSESSDGSTSSGSDDEDSADGEEEEDAIFMDIQKEARRLLDEDAGSDDDATASSKKGLGSACKTKNELPDTKLPPVRLDISASTPIVPLGVIDSVVDDLILVKASVSGEYQVLNEQSVLCFEDRSLLGPVQETFGRVEQPFYTVRLNNAEEVKQVNATVGRKVNYIPSHSTFLFTKTIRTAKGSDASNIHDEEVGDDEREFSDDEAEAEFKKRQKEERKTKGTAQRSQSQTQGQSQLSDAIDEPYVPLSRPANLHEMSAPPSQGSAPSRRETPQRVPNREFQSNRGFRGSRSRGRGGRQLQGRPDFRPNSRHQNQSSHPDHHHREERTSAPSSEVQPPPRGTPTSAHTLLPTVPLPLVPPPDLAAFLPFLAQGRGMPPGFPSGSHLNPAFFPIPPNPQLPVPQQLAQLPLPPLPPPIPLHPSQMPGQASLQPQPPSLEEILNILRAQGHNL